MGALTSRQNAAVEEAEQSSNHAYKYPPKSGNYFGSHFIMGGERFDTPQPESYLFGENADLNFLGNRPTAFPYPPPQANEPTKTLKSLVNIRKESVRFVRAPLIEKRPKSDIYTTSGEEHVDGNMLSMGGGGGGDCLSPSCSYNIEFTFDSDAKCAITIYYFCTEEVSPSGVTLVPRDGLTSETFHYEKGINQLFSQSGHIFNPQLIPEDDLIYNSSKEQLPVAIHCVVEEGNEECRQSHTTICVIDHHPDTNIYVLRAYKQKIFVDGLCYLLQEIYGIENKAVNKTSIDEEIDDHGSECVICMSETRDTLILPCRHLCLCNSCADSLRYQANNCPICRAPFRALLQIRAVQKGVGTHIFHQNTAGTTTGEPIPCDQHVPPGYVPVSLIEALNGPPQYVSRTRNNELVDGINENTLNSNITENHKGTSPLKPNSQRRAKIKKTVSTSTNTSEIGTLANSNTNQTISVVEIGNENTGCNEININNINKKSATDDNDQQPNVRNLNQDKLEIINERLHAKVGNIKRNLTIVNHNASSQHEEDDDSENEKLSPLLSPGIKSKSSMTFMKSIPIEEGGVHLNISKIDEHIGHDEEIELNIKNSMPLKKHKLPKPCSTQTSITIEGNNSVEAIVMNTEDSDYYTPEDAQNSILSPLCPDRLKGNDKLGNLKGTASSFKGGNSLSKKILHKKSTSVGNIMGPASGNVAPNELKGNVSSLPDMLDSPISGNSASTRSSSDSYSSTSSTKQLLSSNPTPTAANIIVDDKTALQNAVNV